MSHARRAVALRTLALVALLATLALPAGAQRGRGRGGDVSTAEPNGRYDGRFMFARIRYEDGLPDAPIYIGQQIPWSHDHPRGERHFAKMLAELTTVRAQLDASVILRLNDPELFKYPVAYMAEPGFWRPNDAEVAALRAYLLKGGFLIFDDFRGQMWFNFESQIRRVLPEARLVRLDTSHPIFDSFYRIETLETPDPIYGAQPEYYGIFEGNDPKKRLMVIVNYNQDLSEYWEYSDMGYFAIDLSNEAYKLGINYIVYALSR